MMTLHPAVDMEIQTHLRVTEALVAPAIMTIPMAPDRLEVTTHMEVLTTPPADMEALAILTRMEIQVTRLVSEEILQD